MVHARMWWWVALILLLGQGLLTLQGAHASVSDLKVGIGDEPPVMEGDAFVMLQGVFHSLSFDVSQGDRLTLSLYAGDRPPAVKNISNYYEFEYTGTGGFVDLMYGTYIDRSKSSRDVGRAKFYAAVDPSVAITAWTLRIDVDGRTELVHPIAMKRVKVGLTLSQPEFVFQVDPFTPKNSTSEQSFRTVNAGNIPVMYTVTFDRMTPRISISGMDGLVHPDETRYHSVSVSIPQYAPQRIQVTARLRADVPASLLKLTGTVSLKTSIEQFISVTILVAHPGYDIIDLGGGKVVIQYEKTRVMEYGEVLTLRTYYTGRVGVSLGVDLVDLQMKDSRLDGASADEPFTMHLSETRESTVEIVITPIRDGVDAKVKYHIESEDGTIVHDFETTVIVGAGPPQDGSGQMPGASLVGLMFILGFFSVMLLLMLIGRARRKHRSRSREEDTEEKASPDRKKGKRATRPRRKMDPRRKRRLDRRRRQWIEKHERKVRKAASKR